MGPQRKEAKGVHKHVDGYIDAIANLEDCQEPLDANPSVYFRQCCHYEVHILEQINIQEHFKDQVQNEK